MLFQEPPLLLILAACVSRDLAVKTHIRASRGEKPASFMLAFTTWYRQCSPGASGSLELGALSPVPSLPVDSRVTYLDYQLLVFLFFLAHSHCTLPPTPVCNSACYLPSVLFSG